MVYYALEIINFYKVYFQRFNQNSDNPRMLNIRDMLLIQTMNTLL